MITIHAGNAAPVFGCVCGCPGLPVWGSRFFVRLFAFFSAFPLYKGIRKNPAALLPIKESIWQQDCRRIFIINANARPLSIGAGLSGLEISKNIYVFLILSDLES